jgi:hypothetical protein
MLSFFVIPSLYPRLPASSWEGQAALSVALPRPEPRRVTLFFTLELRRVHESEVHLQFSQPLPHSCSKTPGICPRAFIPILARPPAFWWELGCPSFSSHFRPAFNFRLPSPSLSGSTFNSLLNPAESALTDEFRVLAEISRNPAPATPLDSALTDILFVSPLESALTKNPGESGIMLTSAKPPWPGGPPYGLLLWDYPQ